MQMTLDMFCDVLKTTNRSNVEKALSILWYFDRASPDAIKSAGQLTKLLTDYHVGTPNQTALAGAIRKTKLANETKHGFTLKPGSRKLIREWLPNIDGIQPAMDHSSGFLPEPVWRDTRGYIEEICREMNGCYQNGYYNAAAILLRRIIETLIIEAYEHMRRSDEIKLNGNYLMLSELAERACGENGHSGLNLGRDAKKALKDVRSIGNWSAHARRFLARSSDLLKMQSETRVLIQELILIGSLNRKREE